MSYDDRDEFAEDFSGDDEPRPPSYEAYCIEDDCPTAVASAKAQGIPVDEVEPRDREVRIVGVAPATRWEPSYITSGEECPACGSGAHEAF